MNENIVASLSGLGLSEKQARVYLSLLSLGEASMTEIADNANLKRPTVYLVVEELINLGLGGEIIKGKKKLYSATHPNRLAEITHLRNEQAKKILSELVALQRNAEKPRVRMLEGLEGMRAAYDEAFASLSNKEEGLWVGNVGLIEEKFPEILNLYYQTIQKLHHPKIREIIYGGEKSKKWAKNMQTRKNSKNHELRYAPEIYRFGDTDQLIIGNKVMTFVLGREIFVLIVESKENADTQRGVFEMAWQKAEKTN